MQVLEAVGMLLQCWCCSRSVVLLWPWIHVHTVECLVCRVNREKLSMVQKGVVVIEAILATVESLWAKTTVILLFCNTCICNALHVFCWLLTIKADAVMWPAWVVTNYVSGEGNAIGHVHLSIYFHSVVESTDFWCWFFACVYDHSSPGIKSQGHRSRSKVNTKMCMLNKYLVWRPLCHHQRRSSVAKHPACCSWYERQRWSPAHVGMVTQSVWPWSTIEDTFSSCSEATVLAGFVALGRNIHVANS